MRALGNSEMHPMNAFVIQRSAQRPWNLLLMSPTRRTVSRHQMDGMGLLYIRLNNRFEMSPMSMTRGIYQNLPQMPLDASQSERYRTSRLRPSSDQAVYV